MVDGARGRVLRWAGAAALAMLTAAAGASPAAKADPIYTITDLGTLPGTTMSVATAINNNGQVVGVSYNASDGVFVQTYPTAPRHPGSFRTTGRAVSRSSTAAVR